MIGYLDKATRPLVLIMTKMGGYVKTFKIFRIDDEKLLEKYKAIWTKIEDLKNIELNTLLVYDEIYKNQNKNIRQ